MSVKPVGEDPKPVPPDMPGDSECCQSGCVPCVYDLYADEMEEYRKALREWETRQVGTPAN